MKTQFLFPNRCKTIGWIFLAIGIIGLLLMNRTVGGIKLDDSVRITTFAIADGGLMGSASYFSFVKNSMYDEFVLALMILGGLFVGFSRCKNEDEFISQIRYESLVWAVYFNFGLLLLSTLFIYGTYYMSVVLHNIFSLLIFFIIRFHIKLYQLQKSMRDDE
ncbi:MAG: hypothetical protein EOO50_12020 [Flavobacterium sp.]|uniref:hypothetical protein n=1 Tax=Flavobacterium sp. TaxID=239 RepID=UPI00121369CB|nr:hypothetical protein [Flavobacterium sp.]RZJ65842.1 MAG: hypothetical protein EOO50_12020 [Flavobacterium sp.]